MLYFLKSFFPLSLCSAMKARELRGWIPLLTLCLVRLLPIFSFIPWCSSFLSLPLSSLPSSTVKQLEENAHLSSNQSLSSSDLSRYFMLFFSSKKSCRYCCNSSDRFSSSKCRCSGNPQDDDESCFFCSRGGIAIVVEKVEMLFLELIKMKKEDSSKY